MKAEKELRDESRSLREKAKSLSGFWVPELAAAAYALEWALEKHPDPPSADIGSQDSAHGKLAESLLKAAQKTPVTAGKTSSKTKRKAARQKR
jgi:hypothetical protein